MSDALDSEAEPSSSNSGIAGAQVGPLAPEITDKEEMEEPEPKRRKLSKVEPKGFDKLEQRLGGILCCAVCLDLPKAAVYQCSNGHLMCAGCFTHVLADARLRDESATCPNCRVEISKDSATRNLAVENAISELPSECQYCSKEFARNSLNHHQDSLCEDRTVVCKYSCIGCPWRGPWHDNAAHEACCQHPRRSGADLLPALQAQQKEAQRNRQLYETLFSLLSYEKITFNELQFKPYRTDEYVNKLFYETTRFSAFNHQWVVKAHINNNQRDPTQSAQREISYQLILKTKTTATLSLHYVVLRGPFGDMRSTPRIYQCEFSERDTESPPSALVFPEDSECNRLLANKAINFRLIMFLSTK